MTITFSELALYAGAIFALFLTPGPVWVAIIARAVSGGFPAAWPLALGVVVGDVIWPFIAILGVSWMVSVFDGFMIILRWVACGMFIFMGVRLIRNADATATVERELTRPGMAAGFMAGVAVILSNPKAIVFYMGVLPGFFDLTKISKWDVFAIVVVSMIVPLLGNLLLAIFVDRMRKVLASTAALRRTNIISAILLVGVGLIIPLT
ncbi:MAG: LysE family translocator [Paracoccaceae bacterium]